MCTLYAIEMMVIFTHDIYPFVAYKNKLQKNNFCSLGEEQNYELQL